MKKLALLAAFTFAAGVAVADEKPAAPKAPAAADKAAGHDHAAHAAKLKTHDVEAEVVSVDAEKKTLTLKGESENKTVPVEGKAVAALKTVKTGSKYTLTCKDDEAGNHVAVVAIRGADSKTPTAEKK
jgi:hypothetical protein